MPPSRNSRYLLCDGVKDAAGRLYLTEPEPFPYKELADNNYYQVGEGDTLFSIAHAFFPSFDNPSQLYWVIAWFQPTRIIDPTLGLVPGTWLVIPSEQTVRQEILNESRRDSYTA